MDKLLLKPMEAAEMIGVGRSRIYELLSSNSLESIKIGRSIRISFRALNKWVEQQETDQKGSSSEIFRDEQTDSNRNIVRTVGKSKTYPSFGR